MRETVVAVGDTAFLAMLIAAIESFPTKYIGGRKPAGVSDEGEIYGLLFGQRVRRDGASVFNVALAIPIQVFHWKDPDGIHPSFEHWLRIKEFVEVYPWLQFLGSFHSHPWRPREFNGRAADRSAADERVAAWEADLAGDAVIQMILALTCLTRRVKAVPKRTASSIVSYCGRFKYELKAYVAPRRAKTLAPVDSLLCPTASGLANFDLV
jgi:hypothetical protein